MTVRAKSALLRRLLTKVTTLVVTSKVTGQLQLQVTVGREVRVVSVARGRPVDLLTVAPAAQWRTSRTFTSAVSAGALSVAVDGVVLQS